MHTLHALAPKYTIRRYFDVAAPGVSEYNHCIHIEGGGKVRTHVSKITPQTYYLVFEGSMNTGPARIYAKINSSSILSCMYWSVPAGNSEFQAPERLFKDLNLPWAQFFLLPLCEWTLLVSNGFGVGGRRRFRYPFALFSSSCLDLSRRGWSLCHRILAQRALWKPELREMEAPDRRLHVWQPRQAFPKTGCKKIENCSKTVPKAPATRDRLVSGNMPFPVLMSENETPFWVSVPTIWPISGNKVVSVSRKKDVLFLVL